MGGLFFSIWWTLTEALWLWVIFWWKKIMLWIRLWLYTKAQLIKQIQGAVKSIYELKKSRTTVNQKNLIKFE